MVGGVGGGGGGPSPARALSSRRSSVLSPAAPTAAAPHAAPSATQRVSASRPALLLLLGLSAAAVLLVWGREAHVLQRVSSAIDTVRAGRAPGNGTDLAGDDGSLWDLPGLIRKWVTGEQDEDAEDDASEVESDGATEEVAPIGAEHPGDAGEYEDGGASSPSAAATPAASRARPPPVPPPPAPPARPPGLPAYAQLPYDGPRTLGGNPDPHEEDWLMPAAPGVDVQIRRDLSPWRRGGITLHELRTQKGGKAKLRIANDSVWEQPPGLFSCVMWRNVPYFFVTEVRYILKNFIFGAVLKIADFLRLMFNVAKHTSASRPRGRAWRWRRSRATATL